MKTKYLIPLLLLSVIIAQSIYFAHHQTATRAVIQAQATEIASLTQDRDDMNTRHQTELAALRAELATVGANLNTVVQTIAIINHGGNADTNMSNIVVREPDKPATIANVTTFSMNMSNIVVQEPVQPSVQTSGHP